MPEPSGSKYSRRLLGVIQARLHDEPVILLQGPRSVGKSALLREIATNYGAKVLDLDDLATRDAVVANPGIFMAGPSPVFVDEYQKASLVLDAIKAELNLNGSPGRFILTGSTRHDVLPIAAQALTGRLHRLPVYPLSQGEISGVTEHLLTDLFTNPAAAISTATKATSTTTKEEYIKRITVGGFPMSLHRNSIAARNRWFDDYIGLTLQRDVQEVSKVRQNNALPQILGKLAGQTAQILNINKVAGDLRLTEDVVRSHTKLLEDVFMVYRLPAWGRTLVARTSAHPKIHVMDSGIAARLLRLTPEKLVRRDAATMTELGHLLETFVIGELMKQVSWLDGFAGVGHWRTWDNDEIDLVVERDDGAIIAFEVKTSSRAHSNDFKPMRKLRDKIGDAFLAGVTLYLGEHAYTLEDRLHVLPVDRLWVP